MKKVIAICLCVLLLLAGCGNGEVSPKIPAGPISPAIAQTAAKGTPGSVVAHNTAAVYALLQRNDQVSVLRESGVYYVINLEDQEVLVEQRFVALDGESRETGRTAYAEGGAKLYDNFDLEGEPLAKLAENTVLKILEKIGGCYLCEADGKTGYIDTDDVSSKKIEAEAPKPSGGSKPSGGNKPSGGASGGGSGGASDGNNGGASGGNGGSASGGSQDGGDIELSARASARRAGGMTLSLSTKEAKQYPAEGSILADGAPALLRFLQWGEEVVILSKSEEACAFWIDGCLVTAEGWQVRSAAETPYEAWKGYAKKNANVYADIALEGKAQATLKENTVLQILEEFEDVYLVQPEGGALGYMAKSRVSATEIQPPKPSSKPSGGASGGNSGGDSGGGAPEPTPEWTAPVL